MSKKEVVLIPNGDMVYAVPADVCEKYALEGDNLKDARNVLADAESDVEGQSLYSTNSYSWSTYDYSQSGSRTTSSFSPRQR